MQEQHVLASRWAPVLALLAGGALPLAFAPFGWWWLAPPCLAVLFAIGAAAPARIAARAGYLFGVGFYAVGVSWVYISIGRYGQSGPVLAVLLTALFVAALALFPWFAVKLARWLRPGTGAVALAVAFPTVWVLLEWVRSWLLTGFPWLLIGYSQTDGPLTPLAPMTGVLGLSLATSVLAGLLAWLVLNPRLRQVVPTLVLSGLALLAVQAFERDWTPPSGPALAAVLVQGNVPQDRKWSPDFMQATLDRYRDLTEPHWGVDLIVWPEAAVPNWYHELAREYIEPLAERGRDHGTDLVLGVPFFDVTAAKAYNSVIGIGQQAGIYHKRHLVPFGEYLPLRDIFGSAFDILGAPMSDFDAGTAAEPLQAAGYDAGISICYEIAFGPEVVAMLPAAQLLINVSNDAWFGDSLAPHQHLQMARMRALETGRDLLRATNTGITALIDHKGRIVDSAPQFEITTLTVEAVPRQGATPYVRWRDYPVLGLLAAALIGLIGAHWLRRVHHRGTESTEEEKDF